MEKIIKKYQVFVSSTYLDMKEERQVAVEAILDTGNIPAGMELFKAGKTQLDTIKKWIDNSDIYILILGDRYGSIDSNTNKSYTHLEYEYAQEIGIPVFSIVLDKNIAEQKIKSGMDLNDVTDKHENYTVFKELVLSNYIVSMVDKIESLKYEIQRNLNSIIEENKDLIGWVKANNIITKKVDNKINYTTNHLYKNVLNDSKFVFNIEYVNELINSNNFKYNDVIDILNHKMDYEDSKRFSYFLKYFKSRINTEDREKLIKYVDKELSTTTDEILIKTLIFMYSDNWKKIEKKARIRIESDLLKKLEQFEYFYEHEYNNGTYEDVMYNTDQNEYSSYLRFLKGKFTINNIEERISKIIIKKLNSNIETRKYILDKFDIFLVNNSGNLSAEYDSIFIENIMNGNTEFIEFFDDEKTRYGCDDLVRKKINEYLVLLEQ